MSAKQENNIKESDVICKEKEKAISNNDILSAARENCEEDSNDGDKNNTAHNEQDMGYSNGSEKASRSSATTSKETFTSNRYTDDQQKKRALLEAVTPKAPGSFEDDFKRPPADKKVRLVETTARFSHWKVGPRYEIMRVLGQGSYGEVVQARDKLNENSTNSQKYVAIKRIVRPFEQEIEAMRIYREIAILKQLREHDCVIKLLDVAIEPGTNYAKFQDLFLVFEYVDTDLHKIILSPQYLSTEHVQIFLYQLLKGLKYIHSANVIHRDLKPANILLNEDCSLKICDFGLARVVQQDVASPIIEEPQKQSSVSGKTDLSPPVKYTSLTRQLTKHVVTRWYRSPELILMQPYTSAVDIWSLGCILAELFNMQEDNVPAYQDRQPLFPGGKCAPLSGEVTGIDDTLDQLSVIFSVIGAPSKEDIEKCISSGSIGTSNNSTTTDYILGKLKGVKHSSTLKSKFPASDSKALDLLAKMLQFNPSKRCTVDEALNHEFLKDIRSIDEEKVWNIGERKTVMDECVKSDLKQLKQRTYEEVLWFRDQNKLTNH